MQEVLPTQTELPLERSKPSLSIGPAPSTEAAPSIGDIIAAGQYTRVGELPKLVSEVGGEFFRCHPDLIDSLIGAGYYRMASSLIENGIAATKRDSDQQFRLKVERSLVTLLLGGDIQKYATEGRNLIRKAPNITSQAYAFEVIGRGTAFGVASNCLNLTEMAEAKKLLEAACHIWEQFGNLRAHVRSLLRLGSFYFESGELRPTALLYKEAAEKAVKVNNIDLQIETAYRVSEIDALTSRIKFDALLAVAEPLISKAVANSRFSTTVFLLHSLGRAAQTLSIDSIPFFQRAREVAKAAGNLSGEFQATQAIAATLLGRGDMTSSLSLFHRTLELANQMELPLAQSTSHLALLQIAVHQSRLHDANNLTIELEELTKRCPLVQSAVGIGLVAILSQLKQKERAATACQQLIKQLKHTGSMKMLGQALFFQGHLASETGKWKVAMKLWKEAITVHERNKDLDGQVTTLRALSQGVLLEKSHGKIPAEIAPTLTKKSLSYLNKAEKLILEQAPQNSAMMGSLLVMKSHLELLLKEPMRSLKFLSQARLAYQEVDDQREIAFIDGLSGLVLLDLAKGGKVQLYPESIAALQRALEYFHTQEMHDFAWKMGLYLSWTYFYWGKSAVDDTTRVERWRHANELLHETGRIIEGLHEERRELQQDLFEMFGFHTDESQVFEFAIQLNRDFRKDEEAVEEWVERRNALFSAVHEQ